MSLKKCDLNLFVVFDTMYSERNLTQAAKALAITQPAVSNALARLRKLFNDELFVRTARGMLPTPVADGIAQNVSDALGLLNASIMEREEFYPTLAERTFQFSMTNLALSLPRYLAVKHDLEILPLPFLVLGLDFHLYWHKQSDSDASHRWLREVMTRLFKS